MLTARQTRCQRLVLDANTLLKQIPIQHLAEEFCTTREVLDEVKDKASKQALTLSLIDIKVVYPTEEALSAVVNFSKKTGDYSVLSKADFGVLALAYRLECEAGNRENLRSEPKNVVSQVANATVYAGRKKRAQPKVEKNAEDGPDANSTAHDAAHGLDENNDDDDASGWTAVTKKNKAKPKKKREMGENEGWITPVNLKEKKEEYTKQYRAVTNNVELQPETPVACMTSDYAMQNVILQMGMKLISTDGMQIKELKTYVLRCHACYHVTTDMPKEFCPHCGNATLMRTTCSRDTKGNVTLYLKRNFKYNNRGTIFSMKAPEGGRNPQNVIITEDQPRSKWKPPRQNVASFLPNNFTIQCFLFDKILLFNRRLTITVYYIECVIERADRDNLLEMTASAVLVASMIKYAESINDIKQKLFRHARTVLFRLFKAFQQL